MMRKIFKKPFIIFAVLMAAFYGTLAFLTYNSIQVKIVKIERLHEEIQVELEENEEVSYTKRVAFNRELHQYDRLQNLMQSFWMKWLIDLPEYNPIE